MARLLLDLICASLVLSIYLLDIIAAIEITGASGGVNLATGERPFRQDIDDFAVSGPGYDLFILALIQLQNTNQSDPLSYFQIAGIHGYPIVPWDGVEGNGPQPGYCMHAAVPFPTWHRPYMALYEVCCCASIFQVLMLIPPPLSKFCGIMPKSSRKPTRPAYETNTWPPP